MKNNNYNIGDYVWLIDGGGCSWLFKIVDKTEKHYILEGVPAYDGECCDADLFTDTNSGIVGLIAFEIESFNAEKATEDDIADWIEENFDDE